MTMSISIIAKIPKKLLSYFYGTMTLKRRIMILFLFGALTPFLFVGIISYDTIFSILGTQTRDGVMSNLKQVVGSLEDSLSNLNHVSQQLAYDGTVGKKLNMLLNSDHPFEQSQIYFELKNELNLITFTNPSIGLDFYYFKDSNTYEFESLPVKDDFAPDKLPILFQYYGITYYGPHISSSRYENQFVLSAMRKVGFPSRNDVFVYIETGFNTIQKMIDNGHGGLKTSFLFLDNNREIVYSQIPDVFPKHHVFNVAGDQGTLEGFYWFQQTSRQGWSIVSVISKDDYNKEINSWLNKILLLSIFFLSVSFIIAWLLWKMVYRPLTKFDFQLRTMDNQVEAVTNKSNIPEFEYLFLRFSQMKEQIWNLISEIEKKEKRRLDLEVEKLRYQINPHFLMNTLNTVHWLAWMNGQTEIDRLVQSLNKLLFYNLGKLGEVSNVGEEIDALQQYLILQQIRYDFKFNVQIDVDDNLLKMPMPRFILQPLVENALYHGFKENGYIQVKVRLDQKLEVSIHDNGVGISEEKIEQLLNHDHPDSQKVGLGVGINYVKRSIESHYKGMAALKIESTIGKGTSIYLSLPIAGEVSQ